ncbi:MAG: hypothetical protein FWF02_00095 [Micrococcales bacterium]|nr:hypothetical protein [Micrococcales bacterium]MCL2666099.1 hypothetical protein [Micrococcales bacterium]
MSRPRRKGNPLAKGLVGAVLVVGLGVGVVVGVGYLLGGTSPVLVMPRCTANVDGSSWSLTPEQSDNAALIAIMTVRRGLPAHAATVGLATAIQESKLRNLDYGHSDSLGLFQQRPSQGWGTEEQVTDPVYATGTFYDHLVKVPDWQDVPVTQAAQAVQRSAFPDAYADHESAARVWASALTGHSPKALTCTLRAADHPGSVTALTDRIVRDIGELRVETVDGDRTVVVVDAASLERDDPQRMAWAVGQWAVAVASTEQVVEVQVADQRWTRNGKWTQTDDRAADGMVLITLA